MDYNLPINNLPPQKPTLWEANPKLKTLLLILIFVFLGCGIGLAVFAQWQNQYRQQIYTDTQAGLPKHQISLSLLPNPPPQGEGVTAKLGWKYFSGNTVYGEQYTFSLQYPERWILGESRGSNALTFGQCIIAIGDGGRGMEGYPPPKIEMTTVDGIKATIQTWTDPGSNTVIVNTQVLKGHDDYIFDLTYNPKDTQCLSDYRDILKTIAINN